MRSLVVVLVLVAISFSFSAAASEQPILVRVEVGDRAEALQIGEILNLDEKTRGNVLFGWATVKEIEAVERLGFVVDVVPPEPKDTEALTMCGEPFTAPFPWDCYPTWSQFESMMQYYAATYPTVARLVNLGMSGEGDHELWTLKISDNPDTEENEPEILYTGTMHGDEIVCYPPTVHLIDHILSNYGSDPQITRLVDETVLWINPMSNPDGTFGGGDNTVAGAGRYLPASGVDPNRSFPDPSVPEDPTTSGWPAEVQHMIDLAAAEHFTLAANCHAGAEVFNYPWDVWSVRPVDNSWWIAAGTQFATNAQAASPGGYFTMCPGSCPFPGVTNGYDWYTTSGNRQDFMNWYHGCREVTLELDDAQGSFDAALLDDAFEWTRQAFLDFFDLSLTGFRGVVTDANTGQPVAAEIRVVGHDIEDQRSWVATDPDVGDYHRLIEAGTYDLEISAPGYDPTTVGGVVVQPDSDATVVDVQLNPWPRYTVTGYVTEEGTGYPIEGATVSLVATTFDSAITGMSGAYSIPYVWEDTYTFRVEADGYRVTQTDLQVGPGSTVHDFQLLAVTAILEHDFETTDGGLTPSAGWAWGSDAVAGAHSGSRVWGTVLGGSYANSVHWTLDTPAIDIPEADGAELRFWQWYDIESGYDGARIRISADGGAFAQATPVPDYNDQTITAFGNTPGYTGSAPWHEVTVDLTPYAGQSVVIRWHFGTDSSQTRRGWYLDDVAVTAWGGSIVPPFFSDGFETGNTDGWDTAVGGVASRVR